MEAAFLLYNHYMLNSFHILHHVDKTNKHIFSQMDNEREERITIFKLYLYSKKKRIDLQFITHKTSEKRFFPFYLNF